MWNTTQDKVMWRSFDILIQRFHTPQNPSTSCNVLTIIPHLHVLACTGDPHHQHWQHYQTGTLTNGTRTKHKQKTHLFPLFHATCMDYLRLHCDTDTVNYTHYLSVTPWMIQNISTISCTYFQHNHNPTANHFSLVLVRHLSESSLRTTTHTPMCAHVW